MVAMAIAVFLVNLTIYTAGRFEAMALTLKRLAIGVGGVPGFCEQGGGGAL
jgi:hypothetical protein